MRNLERRVARLERLLLSSQQKVRNSRIRYSRDHYDFTPEEWKEINEIAAGLASEQGEDFYEMSGLEKDEYLRIAIDAYVGGSF